MSRLIDLAGPRIAKKKREQQDVSAYMERVKLDAEIARIKNDQHILKVVMEEIRTSVSNGYYSEAYADDYMDLSCGGDVWCHLDALTTERREQLTLDLKSQGVSRFAIVGTTDRRLRLYFEDK